MSNNPQIKPLTVEIRPEFKRALLVFSSTNLRRVGIATIAGMLEDDACYSDEDGRDMMYVTASVMPDLVHFDGLKKQFENGVLSFVFEELYVNLSANFDGLDEFEQAWFIRNDNTGDMIKFNPMW